MLNFSSLKEKLSKATLDRREAQAKKQANMPDDKPSSYKPLPGDKSSEKDVKLSSHTRKYRRLYKKTVERHFKFFDKDSFLFEKINGDTSPIDNEDIEKALKNKEDETGVPIKYLRIIMRRGMAAWKSGHRPGANQEQWGYSRVNSFLTRAKGTWGRPLDNPRSGADSDVARQIIKLGLDKKLK